MAEKALADITNEQTTAASGDLLFVEKAGEPAKITWGNLRALANLGLTTQAEALLDNSSYSDMRDTLQLGSTATRDIDNTEDLTVNTSSVLSRGGVATAIQNAIGSAAGDVGTYAWAYHTDTTPLGKTYAFGDTVAGADLRPTGAPYLITNFASSHGTSTLASGSALSGTWQCMGVWDYKEGVNPALNGATLWLRIA